LRLNNFSLERGREAEETETSKDISHSLIYCVQTSFTYNADRVVGNGSFGVVFQVNNHPA